MCTPPYPVCQRKMPGNVLQNFLRKAEQVHTLQCRMCISNALRLQALCLDISLVVAMHLKGGLSLSNLSLHTYFKEMFPKYKTDD